MPTFRRDLESIPTYDPGRPITEVSRELGIDDVIKLASNESPVEPFPEVQAAIAAAASGVNRYPETDAFYLTKALAAHHDIEAEQLWVAPGSTAILASVALATLPGGGSSVFADPSFTVYAMATALAGGAPIAVPLDVQFRHDPEAMVAAVRDDTTVVYYCNPNNPTATHTSGDAVDYLVSGVPDRVTIVIDEAYAEYVAAPDFSTAIPLALQRDNVIVARTFSKVYGLAGMRVGYAIGDPGTLESLRRPQAPFAVTSLAQVAAIEALRHQDRVASRVKDNAIGREYLRDEFRARGLVMIDSQTNFVLFEPPGEVATMTDALLNDGVIVRPMGSFIRVTVGTDAENERLIASIDDVVGDST